MTSTDSITAIIDSLKTTDAWFLDSLSSDGFACWAALDFPQNFDSLRIGIKKCNGKKGIERKAWFQACALSAYVKKSLQLPLTAKEEKILSTNSDLCQVILYLIMNKSPIKNEFTNGLVSLSVPVAFLTQANRRILASKGFKNNDGSPIASLKTQAQPFSKHSLKQYLPLIFPDLFDEYIQSDDSDFSDMDDYKVVAPLKNNKSASLSKSKLSDQTIEQDNPKAVPKVGPKTQLKTDRSNEKRKPKDHPAAFKTEEQVLRDRRAFDKDARAIDKANSIKRRSEAREEMRFKNIENRRVIDEQVEKDRAIARLEAEKRKIRIKQSRLTIIRKAENDIMFCKIMGKKPSPESLAIMAPFARMNLNDSNLIIVPEDSLESI